MGSRGGKAGLRLQGGPWTWVCLCALPGLLQLGGTQGARAEGQELAGKCLWQ